MNIINEKNKIRTIRNIEEFQSVVLWGSGSHVIEVIDFFERISMKIVGVCDNDLSKIGSKIKGYVVENPKGLFDKCTNDFAVVISVVSYQYEIAKELENTYKIHENRIFSFTSDYAEKNMYEYNVIYDEIDSVREAYDILEDNESKLLYENLINNKITRNPRFLSSNECQIRPYVYQSRKCITVSPDAGDTIIDAGAFIGDTAEYFMNITNGKCFCICIEPLEKNFETILEWRRKNGLEDRIRVYHTALGKKRGKQKLYTDNNISVNASVIENTKIEFFEYVDINTLDDMFLDEVSIDYIKFDIEGSEIEALEGGKKFLKKYSPKMMISAYHKTDHLWKIPKIIKEIFPDAKIFLGHQINAPFEPEYYVLPSIKKI